MQSSDFEKDIKANALQKSAPFKVTTKAPTPTTTPARIALTKTTFLTPIQKTQPHQLQQHKQKQLYTTLTAKQPTPTGNVKSTNLGKVVITDFMGIIKPIVPKTLPTTIAATKTTTLPATASPLISPIKTATTFKTNSKGEVDGKLNVAIVAAKRPQLTIVATKTAALIDNTSLGTIAVTTSPVTTASAPTTTASLTNVIFMLIFAELLDFFFNSFYFYGFNVFRQSTTYICIFILA